MPFLDDTKLILLADLNSVSVMSYYVSLDPLKIAPYSSLKVVLIDVHFVIVEEFTRVNAELPLVLLVRYTVFLFGSKHELRAFQKVFHSILEFRN